MPTHMPQHGVFLVDTYEPLQGIRNAIDAARHAKIPLQAIRLDSGDLAWLSQEARKLLDHAGYHSSKIIASNNLSPSTIETLKKQNAPIDAWLVGTHLVNPAEGSALGGVYKIGSVQHNHRIREVIKISADAAKISLPGSLDVIRYVRDTDHGQQYCGDTIVASDWLQSIKSSKHHQHYQLPRDVVSINLQDVDRPKCFARGHAFSLPLQNFMHEGQVIDPVNDIHAAQQTAQQQLAMLDIASRRLQNPHIYVAGIEQQLFKKRQQMIHDFSLP